MNVKEAAAALDGNEYGREGSKELFAKMRENRLLAFFGYSDDIVEFRGYEDDEVGASTILLDRDGIVVNRCECDDCPYWRERRALAEGRVKPLFGEGEVDGIRWSWRFETQIPHETFRIYEDGENYCLGIVISLDDLS